MDLLGLLICDIFLFDSQQVKLGREEFTFTVQLGSKLADVVRCTLAVTGEAAPLDRWQLVQSKEFSVGIMASDSSDLQSKLLGVILYDKNNTVIPVDTLDFPRGYPKLTVRTIRDDDDDKGDGIDNDSQGAVNFGDQDVEVSMTDEPTDKKRKRSSGGAQAGGKDRIVRVKRRFESESGYGDVLLDLEIGDVVNPKGHIVRGFVLSPGSCIKGQSGRHVMLTIEDPEIKCDGVPAMVVPGWPSTVKLSCSAASMSVPSTHHDVTVTRFQQLEDIALHFEDSEGNSCAEVNTKNITVKVVRCRVDSNEPECLFRSRKRGDMPTSIPFHFMPASFSIPEELQVLASFERKGQKNHSESVCSLSPVRLLCTIEPVQIVEQVAVEVMNSKGDSINRISCEETPMSIMAYCRYGDDSNCVLTSTDNLSLVLKASESINEAEFFGPPRVEEEGYCAVWELLPSAQLPLGPLEVTVLYSNVAHTELPEDLRTV